MRRAASWSLSAALILAGLAAAAFFGGVLGIADCTARCQERGERAPAIAFVAAGLGLALAGALLPRQGAYRAFSYGLVLAGAITTLGAGYVASQGGRGAPGLVTLLVGAGAVLVGAWMLWVASRR